MALRQIAKTKYDWDAAWMAFLSGAKHKEIERDFGIPYSNIVAYSREHHWTHRRSQSIRYASQVLKEGLKKRIEENRLKHQHFVMDKLEMTQDKIDELTITHKEKKEEGEVGVSHMISLIDQQHQLAKDVLGLDKDKEKDDPVRQGFAILMAMRQANGLPIDQPITHEVQVEKHPSAYLPLPDDSEANTGILSSLNAIPVEEKTPKSDINEQNEEEPGDRATEEEVRPLPRSIFSR